MTFFDDLDDRKADQVDGAIGELSAFHETFGGSEDLFSVTGVDAIVAVLREVKATAIPAAEVA